MKKREQTGKEPAAMLTRQEKERRIAEAVSDLKGCSDIIIDMLYSILCK